MITMMTIGVFVVHTYYQNTIITQKDVFKKQVDSVRDIQISKPHVQILLWTHLSNTLMPKEMQNVVLNDCVKCRCRFTNNKSNVTLTNAADAVIFNLRNEQLLTDGKINLPEYHPPDQYWILYNHEAMFLPDFFYDAFPGDVFNLTATYRRDSDIHMPYGKCGPRKQGNYVIPADFLQRKTGLVVWHVSHCTDRSRRMTFTKILQKYVDVDIFGRCSEKYFVDDHRIHVGQNLTDVAAQNINKYKFYLSFENTYCRDYITEKTFKIFQDNIYTVPIVRGSGPYKDILPPDTYIDADDFANAAELADYLKKLDKNDDLYMKYFKSRPDYQCSTDSYDNTHWLCKLCDGVASAAMKHIHQVYNQTEIRNVIHPSKNCDLYDRKTQMPNKTLAKMKMAKMRDKRYVNPVNVKLNSGVGLTWPRPRPNLAGNDIDQTT